MVLGSGFPLPRCQVKRRQHQRRSRTFAKLRSAKCRASKIPQIGRQGLNEFFPAHRELALIAHAGREGEPDPGREICSDRNMCASGAFGAVVVKTVMVQRV